MTPTERAEKIYNELVNPSSMASLRTGGIALIAAELEAYASEYANKCLENCEHTHSLMVRAAVEEAVNATRIELREENFYYQGIKRAKAEAFEEVKEFINEKLSGIHK